MPSVKITEQQAALFQQKSAEFAQVERELRLVTAAILGGHNITEAFDVQLLAPSGESPMLVYRVSESVRAEEIDR